MGVSFFLSVLFSLNPAQSLFGEYFYLQGALFYLFVAVHFLICWKIFSEKGIVEKFLGVVKWVGLGAAAYAVVQYFFLDPEVVGRVYGTVGNPNFLAARATSDICVTDSSGTSGRPNFSKRSLDSPPLRTVFFDLSSFGCNL